MNTVAEPVRIDVIEPDDVSTLELEPQPARPLVVQAQQPSSNEAGSLIRAITTAASDPNVDIEKMERLWAMVERVKDREREEAFNAAMNKAQSEMGRVSADAANPQTKSLYATYGKLDAKVRPVYTKHGFSISFNEGDGAPEGHVRILAYVSHAAGHTRTYKADLPNDGKGAKGGDVMTKTHATGSAHTYGRRYLLKDIFNIAIGEEDNDGNGDGDDEHDPDGLDLWRAEAMKGEKALRAYYDAQNPTEAFWKQHGPGLRKAAKDADAGVQR